MSAVYKKEVKAYLTGMTGAIFMGFILLMTGIFMVAYNLQGGYPNFELSLSGITFIYLLAIPILTMRSIAEEKHSRTDQLLYSLPMPLSSVVLAKYFAMVTMLAVPCGIMLFYPLILSMFGTVTLSTAYAMILAFFLLGAALISIGMFISSLTESQVISAVVSLIVMLLIYFMSGLSSMISDTAGVSLACFIILALIAAAVVQVMMKNSTISLCTFVALVAVCALVYVADSTLFEGLFPNMLNGLDMFNRLTSFQNGMFDLTTIIYFISISALFVYLTVQSMEKKRWN